MLTELEISIGRLLLECVANAFGLALVTLLAFLLLDHSHDRSKFPSFRYVKYILTLLFLPFVLFHIFSGARCHCGKCQVCRWWEW